MVPFAMREAIDDVATERLLKIVARLLATMPRSRGFRIGADGSISIYPATPRVRPPAERHRKALPCHPSVTHAWSRGASVHRTHAPAAALNARRSTPKCVRRRKTACSMQLADKMAKVQCWRVSQRVWTAFMRDRATAHLRHYTPLPVPTFPAQPTAASPAPAAASSPKPATRGY